MSVNEVTGGSKRRGAERALIGQRAAPQRKRPYGGRDTGAGETNNKEGDLDLDIISNL